MNQENENFEIFQALPKFTSTVAAIKIEVVTIDARGKCACLVIAGIDMVIQVDGDFIKNNSLQPGHYYVVDSAGNDSIVRPEVFEQKYVSEDNKKDGLSQSSALDKAYQAINDSLN